MFTRYWRIEGEKKIDEMRYFGLLLSEVEGKDGYYEQVGALTKQRHGDPGSEIPPLGAWISGNYLKKLMVHICAAQNDLRVS